MRRVKERLHLSYQVSHNSLYTFNNCHSSLRWNPGAGWYLDSGLRQNDIFYLNSITHALSLFYNETVSKSSSLPLIRSCIKCHAEERSDEESALGGG